MLEPLEELNHNNSMKMNKHDDCPHILDSIMINLDQIATLDEVMRWFLQHL